MTDSDFFYQLCEWAYSSAEERLLTFMSELAPPISMVAGSAKLLTKEADRLEHVSQSMHKHLCSLEQAAEQLIALRSAGIDKCRIENREVINDSDLRTIREQFAGPISSLIEITEDLQSEKLSSIAVHEVPASEIIEIIERQAHCIQAMLDTLVNPNFEIPSHIVEWLAIRDKVCSLAYSGDQKALEPIRTALKSSESSIRCTAIRLLGHIKDDQSVKILLTALEDEDKYVRAAAAQSLGSVGDTRAIEPLTESLKDRDSYVRHIAKQALELIDRRKDCGSESAPPNPA